MTAAVTAFRYRGMSAHYTDIATRNDQHLGLAVEYAVHPKTQKGCFILRFVVHSETTIKPQDFTHFTYREPAGFGSLGSHGFSFKGVRLNKIALEVFDTPVYRHEVDGLALKFGVYNLLEEWVAEQVQAEGFTLTADLQKEIREMVALPSTANVDEAKSILSFPNLADTENKAAAYKQMQKPEPDADPEADEDEDDGEEEPWLN